MPSIDTHLHPIITRTYLFSVCCLNFASRSRLSLDLSSPTSELSTNVKKITTPTGSFPAHLQQQQQSSQFHNGSNNNNNNSLSKSKSNSNNNLSTACVNNNNSITVLGNSAGPVLIGNGAQQPIVSSRYTEFKTYSSTFDALQALESANNNSMTRGGATGNGTATVVPVVPDNDSSLIRVSALPAVTPPQHPGPATGKHSASSCHPYTLFCLSHASNH